MKVPPEEVDLPPDKASEEIDINRRLFKLQDGIALVPADKAIYGAIIADPLTGRAVV